MEADLDWGSGPVVRRVLRAGVALAVRFPLVGGMCRVTHV